MVIRTSFVLMDCFLKVFMDYLTGNNLNRFKEFCVHS